MKRPTMVFPIMLALGAITLVPFASAQAQDAPQEGPREIEKCRTIDEPGSYKLVNNLTFTSLTGACLQVTDSNVTIDLAGFTINGPGNQVGNNTVAITAGTDTSGISVRNGSISGFFTGVELAGNSSIVEGLHVSGPCPCSLGIGAIGIVKGNTVVGIAGLLTTGVGISAIGIVTGNYVIDSRLGEYQIGQGSTVIGNTAIGAASFPARFGFSVSCPSNVTDNTAVNNAENLVLDGAGCNNTNNVAP
jgi:hypothetical protein